MNEYLPNICYFGKLTTCHSYGFLGAFFPAATMHDLLLFEAVSGVPYGVLSQEQDANRLLTTWLDPDLGLDHAMNALGLEFELYLQSPEAAEQKAIDHLCKWLLQGFVLLGPLDMGALPYLFFGHIFRTCDHYVIALRQDGDRFLLQDSEGYDMVWINSRNLIKAWRSEHVPEGRGAFIMRRLSKSLPLRFNSQTIVTGLKQAATLLQASACHPRGGANGYIAIANEEAHILTWPAACRSLNYLLPIRMQRNIAADTLLKYANIHFPYLTSDIEHIASITRNQTFLLGQCLIQLRSKKRHCLAPLMIAADIEIQLMNAYGRLKENICDAALNI